MTGRTSCIIPDFKNSKLMLSQGAEPEDEKTRMSRLELGKLQRRGISGLWSKRSSYYQLFGQYPETRYLCCP